MAMADRLLRESNTGSRGTLSTFSSPRTERVSFRRWKAIRSMAPSSCFMAPDSLSATTLRSRTAGCLSLAALLLLALSPAHSLGQTPAPAAPGAQTPSTPASPALPKRDLTLPQAQPSLTTDRDPIFSPDPEEKPAPPDSNVTIKSQAGPSGVIQKEGNGFILRKYVDEVLLKCTVVDDKGRLVTNLDRTRFRIWEDNVPQTVSSFQHQDVPVSLGILIDNSGSMRDKRGAVNDAALHLVRASNPSDAEFVVNFSDRAILDQGFTSNIADLEKGLSHVDSRGGTALYDAVVASANEMSRHAKEQKQVLLIITDGLDNASRLSLDQAIRRVRALDGPTVYAIGLLYEDLTKQEAQRAREELESLALETGGVAYFPRSLQEVNDVAAQVASDLRNQYTLGYHSTKEASLGGYRTVHVEAIGAKNQRLTVRTRRGYVPKAAQTTETTAQVAK
jgi:Ca-activated chloride channel family protein